MGYENIIDFEQWVESYENELYEILESERVRDLEVDEILPF